MSKFVKRLLDFVLQDLKSDITSSVFVVMFRFMFLEEDFRRNTEAKYSLKSSSFL